MLKTNKEKGSALLQRFVQQSNQNNLDERKAVCKELDRTLTEAGSNDDMITELEFTEALSGLSKDTAPGPDRVKYSDIKNLSVDNKSELFRLYEESFATGQFPEDWSDSYLKPIPKPGKDLSKLNGYRILTMQNTTGKLMERIVARKNLERRNVLPSNQGGYRAGLNHLGKRSQIRIRCPRRIPEEGTNSGRGGRSGRCVQQSAVQTADGTPWAIWRQLDAHKMARSSTPGKKGRHATWKLDLYAPTTDNGTSTRLPSVPCPLQCLHKGTGRSEQQWLRLRTMGLFTKQPVASAQQSLLSRSSWKRCDIGAKRQSPKSTQARRKPRGAPSTTKK